MDSPMVVEVVRSEIVESVHDVDVAVVSADGGLVDSWGEARRPVLPRSAAKPLQAVPVVATGAADGLGLTAEHLALVCSSHHGEDRHVALVGDMLALLGHGRGVLQCGVQRPLGVEASLELARSGREPTEVHNNCSGKHCGFLAVARTIGAPPAGYTDTGHPVQRDHVTPAIEELCRVSLQGEHAARDGCGAPVWSLPLDALAAGWARLARRGAGRRLLEAMTAHPDLVAGTAGTSTELMERAGGLAAVKTGHEGVCCAVSLNDGVAIAVKARDGASRAAAAAAEWTLDRLGILDIAPTRIVDVAGNTVGQIRVRP